MLIYNSGLLSEIKALFAHTYSHSCTPTNSKLASRVKQKFQKNQSGTPTIRMLCFVMQNTNNATFYQGLGNLDLANAGLALFSYFFWLVFHPEPLPHLGHMSIICFCRWGTIFYFENFLLCLQRKFHSDTVL